MTEKIYLSIGSNIGDRVARLNDALRKLKSNKNIIVVRVSAVYETQPWGFMDQKNFYNIAVAIKTDLEPEVLLAYLHSIESDMHRVHNKRWGPRVIDLDIIYWGLQTIHTIDLEIPHPYATDRIFVLRTIKDIAIDDPEISNLVDRYLLTCSDNSWIKMIGEVNLHYV